MKNKTNLINFLKENAQRRDWLNIANELDIMPFESNKKKSDYIRRLAARLNNKSLISEEGIRVNNIEYTDFLNWKKQQSLTDKIDLPKPFLTGDPKNVLVVPDLHIPFEHKNALLFCREQQEKWNCGTVIFIGDIIDNHYHSFHDTDADGLSGGMELEQAILKLKSWYEVFPEVTVILGNHDRLVFRRLYSSGISSRWIQPIEKILGVHNWNFVEEVFFNDVLYIHGEESGAELKASQEFTSVVQGHRHTEAYIKLLQGREKQIFAMQVGTMIDFDTYAFNYAKRGKKPILSCGIVIDKHPLIIPFNK